MAEVGAGDNGLIILRNSNYVNKYIVDADELNFNFKKILEASGTTAFQDLIESTGQIYNPLVPEQLINAIVQLIVASNYFKDTGTANNLVLEPFTPGYGVPTTYINNMSLTFTPSYQNTGATLLSIKGLSAVKVLTDMGEELSSGSLLPNQNYTAKYDASKNAFILTSSFEDSGSQALSSIRKVIESAGLTFSSVLYTQLAQAVAAYSLSTSYDVIVGETSQQLNNYVLVPFGDFFAPSKYYEGMVLRFRPPFENTLSNPTAQLGNLTRYGIFNANGDSLQPGDISTSSDVVLKFTNNSFLLVSNRVNSLQLKNGTTVNNISNDVSLSSNSTTTLPTEYAVKNYVDSRVKAGKGYSVVSGKELDGQANYLRKESDSTINILAGEAGKPSYKNIANTLNVIAAPNRDPEEDPDYPEDTITFGPTNMFNGDNSSYYETLAQGSDVLGVKDPSTGEYTLEVSYVGAKDLRSNISRISLMSTSFDSQPSKVSLQYATVYSSGGGYVWQDIGEIENYIDPDDDVIKKKVIPTVYDLPFIGGTPNNIDLENFVPRSDATDLESNPVYPYAFRVVPVEFTGTGGWKVVSMEFSVSDEPIDPLVLSYSDNSLETIITQTLIDVYGYNGDNWIIRLKNSDYQIVSYDDLTESFTEPVNPEEGDFWTKLSNSSIDTYMYSVTSMDNEGNPLSYGWVPQQYVKVGSVTVANDVITSFYPISFNGKFSGRNIRFSNSPMTFTHHIGSLSSSKIVLSCVSQDGTYNVGDTIELPNYSTLITNTLAASTSVAGTSISIPPHTIGSDSYHHTITPNPHTHTAATSISGAISASYSIIASTSDVSTLMYYNLAFPNKVTGEITTIDTSKWTISIVCERAF